MLVKRNYQQTFTDFPFTEFIYNQDNILIKLNNAINWDNLLFYLSQFYSPNKGRPTGPLRAKVGTEIIKRIKNLSDRDAVNCVKENIYAQYFCGLLPSQVNGYMNPNNGLSNFRGQIGTRGLAFISEILTSLCQKKPLKKGNTLILDTTCIPLDIHYPTDIKLLERCRLEIINLIDKAKQLGLTISYRTYSRIARKLFVNFSKLSKPKEKTRKKVHKQLIQFVRRNLKQLVELRKKSIDHFKEKVKNNDELLAFLQQLKNSERKIRVILHQQKQIYHGFLQITERIVSFHKDHIRPIKRGKFPLDTEFGHKILIAVVRGYTYVIETFCNNVSDSTLVVPSLKWFKKTFGRFPRQILGDRGFFSRYVNQWLKTLSITSGIQHKGRSPITSNLQRRLTNKRQIIETRISLAKRKFGWGKCLAKNIQHEPYWIRLQAAALNVHLSFLQPP